MLEYDFAGNNGFLGQVTVDLAPLHMQSGAVKQGLLPLQRDAERHPTVVPTGTITIEVTPQFAAASVPEMAPARGKSKLFGMLKLRRASSTVADPAKV